jgi:hypothetical protein
MNSGDIFVAMIAGLSLVASGAYFYSEDYIRALYWIGGTILVGSTIFIGRM